MSSWLNCQDWNSEFIKILKYTVHSSQCWSGDTLTNKSQTKARDGQKYTNMRFDPKLNKTPLRDQNKPVHIIGYRRNIHYFIFQKILDSFKGTQTLINYTLSRIKPMKTWSKWNKMAQKENIIIYFLIMFSNKISFLLYKWVF